MNVYSVLTFILLFLIGVIIGMVIQSLIDGGEIRELSQRNEQLETENTLLTGQVEPKVVEVIHKHVIENKPAEDLDFSQKW